MDLADSPEDVAYRESAAQWLALHAPSHEEPPSGRLTVFGMRTPEESAEHVRAALAWQACKYADARAGIGIPTDQGGSGGAVTEKLIFAEEEARYRVPVDAESVTQGMVVPTLATWANEQQRERYLTPILSGQQLSCQLFSEPNAGSDLAAIRTSAQATSDGWVLNGQKIWTSYAQYATFGYVIARTGEGPRHHGLTAFLVDLRQPGVTVRPIRQATGAQTFNEVFFDNAVVEADSILGESGQGWQVVLSTLMAERYSLEPEEVGAHALVELLGGLGDLDAGVRRRAADVVAYQHILTVLKLKLRSAASEGLAPGPEGSVTKLLTTTGQQLAAETALDALGADGVRQNQWSELLTGAFGLRVGGGTDEIMRNVIAERVLSLPREPQPAESRK